MDGDLSPRICRRERERLGAHEGYVEGKRVGAVGRLALRWTILHAVLEA